MRIIIPMTENNPSLINDFFLAIVILAIIALLTWGRWNLLAASILILFLSVYLFINIYVHNNSNFIQELSTYLSSLSEQGELIDNSNIAINLNGASLLLTQNIIRFIICLLAYLMLARFRLPMPLAMILLFLVPISVKAPYKVNLLWLIPAAIALILSAFLDIQFFYTLNRKNMKIKLSHKRASLNIIQLILPISLAIIISLALIPIINHSELFSPYLQGIVDDLSNSLPRSFDNQLKLSNLNISGAGYYNESGDLGGPVELNDNPVFKLSVDNFKPLYLASSKYVDYDLNRWSISATTDYYRFGSPFTRAVEEKNTIYKIDLEAQKYINDINENFPTISYQISPLSNNQQSILLAGNVKSLSLPRNSSRLFYYNAAGNLYAGSNLDKDVPYTVEVQETPILNPSAENDNSLYNKLSESINKLANFTEESSSKKYAERFFLSLPPRFIYQVGGEVYNLAKEITSGLNNNYEKVIALKNFFNSQEFNYSLNVRKLLPGEDLVEALLKDKTGYCVYYATAMTLMARELGIPARYVEGYRVPNKPELDENGNFIMTENYAHAWTEVYLDGLNWIIIDPTPGNNPDKDNSINQSEAHSQTQDIQTSTTRPKPTPPTPSKENKPPTQKPPKRESASFIVHFFIYLLLFLFLAILIIYMLMKRGQKELHLSHNHQKLLNKVKNKQEALLPYYWFEIRKILELLPVSVKEQNQSHNQSQKQIKSQRHINIKNEIDRRIDASFIPRRGFLKDLQEQVSYYEQLLPPDILYAIIDLVLAIEKIYYSQHQINKDEIIEASQIYDYLENELKRNLPKFIYLAKRILTMKSVDKTLKDSLKSIAKK